MANKEHVTDSDLDELLDDALLDFEKPPKAPNNTPLSKGPNPNPITGSGGSSSRREMNFMDDPTALFSQFFDEETTKQLHVEWDNALKELKAEDVENVKSVGGENSSVPAPSSVSGESSKAAAAGDATFDDKVKTMLDSMSQNIKNTTEQGAEGDLPGSFGNLNLDGLMEDGALDNEVNMMENLMTTLLSKEMMYEPMKSLCTKFGPWIEENTGKLSEEKMTGYNNQLRCLKKICSEFEEEKDGDNKQSKDDRSQRIIALVDELQQFGEPPTELTGDVLPGGDLPSNLAQQCCIS